MRESKDVYGEPTIITNGNWTARVYSPILTEEEYNRRMNEIKKATAQLMAAKLNSQKR
jgi:hypothetical protein